MIAVFIIMYFALVAFMAWLTGKLADEKGYNKTTGRIFGALFGFWAIMVYIILDKKIK